jgi:hypothetical protein
MARLNDVASRRAALEAQVGPARMKNLLDLRQSGFENAATAAGLDLDQAKLQAQMSQDVRDTRLARAKLRSTNRQNRARNRLTRAQIRATLRGQNLSAATQRRGQNITAFTQQRGQNMSAATAGREPGVPREDRQDPQGRQVARAGGRPQGQAERLERAGAHPVGRHDLQGQDVHAAGKDAS